MNFKQRIPYYLIGLIFGIILVIFFLDKKSAEFDYLPNSRVLKSIRRKPQIYSSQVLSLFQSNKVDSLKVATILKNGDVDIWNKIKQDTCMTYTIQGKDSLKNLYLTVKRCDSIAYIQKIKFK
ncbi:MAG: DUF4258 domain-containing protein [Lutibacter sp.]|uniref:DUF4258 domain-containing protein n=1 Tax=Lutibacter sp. TaxID=1925666 RepID=UPI00385E08B8